MQYENMVSGIFHARPNRFIAHIEIDGQMQICHVKNTGRCKELLVPGCRVWCQHFRSTTRKTQYDLIAVEKGGRIINMDSQAPNAAVKEWLLNGSLGNVDNLRPETIYGDSRFDFSFSLNGKPCLMEVKGVTLEDNGICAFPDAPTLRGVKHLHGLAQAVKNGFDAYVLFAIQMHNIISLQPNDATDPAFGQALRQAAAAGVKILAYDCVVSPESMALCNPVNVCL